MIFLFTLLLRQLLQVKRDEVTKEINDFKNEYGKLMAGVTKKITDGKAEHHRLSDYVRFIFFFIVLLQLCYC